ncbi:MAG: hypothetical protein IT236_11955 [Bacteroidia bacterium]|nr:hypothetical protein [Bacteroidia bacterium]
MANYLENKTTFEDFLGYHEITTSYHEKALQLLNENCFFLPNELNANEQLTKKNYLLFLSENFNKITFNRELVAFYITPLQNQSLSYHLIELSPLHRESLLSVGSREKDSLWYTAVKQLDESQSNLLIKALSTELIFSRSRWNEYCYDCNEIVDFLKRITNTDLYILSEGESANNNNQQALTANSFEYGVFFLKHFQGYVWDNKLQRFINPTLKSVKQEAILNDLDAVYLGADSLYLKHAEKLSNYPSAQLIPLLNNAAGKYGQTMFSGSTARFIKAACLLKEYCRSQGLNYTVSGKMLSEINQLKKELSLSEDLKHQQILLSLLNLKNVAALELHAILNGDNEGVNAFSRVLDQFYSANMNVIINDSLELTHYLKKSSIFTNIGIIGTINTYPWKLNYNKKIMLERLQRFCKSQLDKEVIMEAQAAILLLNTSATKKSPITWEGNDNYKIENLTEVVNDFKSLKYKDALYDYQRTYDKVFSRINYAQIPEMMALIESLDSTQYPRERIFNFLIDDFGIPVEANNAALEEFKKVYAASTEAQLYRYYLDKCGIKYKTTTDSLDYTEIYKVLKFNINVAFIGGGGGYTEYCVYPLIKILENKFNTRLNFPSKLCNWQGTWGCNSTERAKTWIKYLKDNNLIHLQEDEAPTWSYK